MMKWLLIKLLLLLLLLLFNNINSIYNYERKLEHHNALPIPLLSVTIATDANNYLIRLLNRYILILIII